jgi:hypothetical protein
MTRSILWIISRAPSSPFSIGCVALPQPRSRMALAAETRAAAVASFDRMTPTRTLSADLVWLRARERISVIVLTISAHENPSHTAIAIKPTSESDIRYAVMPTSWINKMCGMIAVATISGREPLSLPCDPHGG